MRIKNNFAKIFAMTLFAQLISYFQNCDQAHVSIVTNGSGSLASNASNGEGYSGKTQTFYRMNPDFTCESHVAPVSSLEISVSRARFIENRKLACGAAPTDLDPALVEHSSLQNEIVGYREGIFEGLSDSPTRIPANLVEVWCRDADNASGLETITHYDRDTKTAVTKIFSGAANVADFSVARVITSSQVNIRDGQGFELNVYRDRPSLTLGKFEADLTAIVNGKSISQKTFCRVGGSLDPQIWPSQMIVDSQMLTYKLATDKTQVAYYSFPQGLYTADLDGKMAAQITPKGATFIGDYDFVPDTHNLIYVSDSAVPDTPEVFRFDARTKVKTQLSTHAGTYKDLETSVRISSDKKHIVYNGSYYHQADANMLLLPIDGSSAGIEIGAGQLNREALAHFVLGGASNRLFFIGDMNPSSFYVTDLDDETFGHTQMLPLALADHNWKPTGLIDPSAQSEFVLVFTKDTVSQANGISAISTATLESQSLDPNLYVFAQSSTASRLLLYDQPSIYHLGFNYYSEFTLIDLKRHKKYKIPGLENAAFTKDESLIFGVTDAPNSNRRIITVSAIDGSVQDLCAATNGLESLRAVEIASNRFFVSAYHPQSKILRMFVATRSGGCQLVNSIPISLGIVRFARFSNDGSKALVNVVRTIDNREDELLFYVPLDGKASYQINSPLFLHGSVNEAFFTQQDRAVVYLGYQSAPFFEQAFLWKVPDLQKP